MATTTEIETRKIECFTPTFTSIPVLDLSLAQSPVTKPKFLSKLRDALVMVGFFYLKNTSIPENVEETFVERSKAFLDLDVEKKLEIDMINSKHFLGYSRLGCEKTARETDNREMVDVSRWSYMSLPGYMCLHDMFGSNLESSSLRRFRLLAPTNLSTSTFRAQIRYVCILLFFARA